MKVEILRCFKSNINGKVNGEYYVYDIDGSKHLVFQNNNEIKIIEHMLNKNVRDCVVTPTQKVINVINEAVEEYLTGTKEEKND